MDRINIAVYGSYLTGKTSFCRRFVNKTFSPNENSISILGSFFTKINIDEKKVDAIIWDTGGDIHRSHMLLQSTSNANCKFVLYDVTNYSSFQEAIQLIGEIKSNNQVITLIGTKIDKYDQRKVQTEEALIFAQTYNLLFFEVSSLTGCNIEESFKSTVREFIKNNSSYSQAEEKPEMPIKNEFNSKTKKIKKKQNKNDETSEMELSDIS